MNCSDGKGIGISMDSLLHALISAYNKSLLLRHMLCNLEIDRSLQNTTYMITVFEVISSIIQL